MNLTPIVTKSKRTSNVLLRDISRRSSLNRTYEKKTLELLKKSIEERGKTYSALSKRDKQGGGLLGNLLGGSLLLRRLRGRGPKGPGSIGPGGIRPKSPIRPRGGGTIGGGVGRLGRFGRIGPLAVLGTGLDFAGRVGSGQNIAQATIGAGGGLAGALAGGAKGAAIGTAIGGPLGTLIGGVGGSILGGFAGGGIADLLTGASDNKRRQEIQQIEESNEKSKFSKSLDKFDNVIDNFEGSTTPLIKDYKENKGKTGGGLQGFIRRQAPGLAIGSVIGGVLGTIGTIILQELAITAALAVAPVPGTRFIAAGRLLAKIPLLARFGRVLLRLRSFLSKLPISKTVARVATTGRLKKTVLFPERATGFNNQGVLRQLTRGPARSNIIRRNRFRLDPRLKDIMDDTDGLSKITMDQIKKNVGRTPSGQDPKILEQIVGGLRKEGKIDPIGGSIINPGTRLNIGKKFSPGSGTVKPSKLLENFKQLDLDLKDIKPRQEGGRVEAGTPYMVGELGKELFVPDVSGDIIPNDQLGPAMIAMTSDPDTIIKSSGGGDSSGGGTVIVPASPYDVVAKYAQMTGLFTV